MISPEAQIRATMLAALCLFLLTGTPADAQEAANFVLRIGNDTVAVERYTRSATEVNGRQLLRTPRATIREYSARLDGAGHPTAIEIRIYRPGETTPMTRAEVRMMADSARVTLHQGDSTRVMTLPATRGAIPFLGYSVGLYEIPLASFRRGASASATSTLLPLGSTTPYQLTIGGADGDWLAVTNIAGESRVQVDQQGRILRWDGTGSTLKLEGERLTQLDFDGMVEGFLTRERNGQALGSLSPRDSVVASVAGTAVRVDYSRPGRRGRTIAGGVVPWGSVWRTGANAATLISFDRDVLLGDARVPAGSYSLWTLPTPEGWTLIVNSQTGQWGTDHDTARDLVRVPMRSEPPADRPEQFTIAVRPDGDGGRLTLTWDDVHVWVPVRPAR